MAYEITPQDLDMLTLCVYEEARGETNRGQRAVARVVLNRRRLGYASDGTIIGTVLHRDQFSGFWFEAMMTGTGEHKKWHYTRVCSTMHEACVRAGHLMATAMRDNKDWNKCKVNAALEVHEDGRARYGTEIGLDANTVLYYNPEVTTNRPTWAMPSKKVAVIGHHEFFHS